MRVTEESLENGSSKTIIGNGSTPYSIVPPTGGYLIVKGMLITGSGNNGVSTIETSSGRILLPLYHSNQNSSSPAGRTNLILDVDETINLVATGRGPSDPTFFGVSVVVKEG